MVRHVHRKSLVSISSLTGQKQLMKKSRSSYAEVFSKKGTFKKFAKFTGKHLHWSLFLELQIFHVSSAKCLRTPIL